MFGLVRSFGTTVLWWSREGYIGGDGDTASGALPVLFDGDTFRWVHSIDTGEVCQEQYLFQRCTLGCCESQIIFCRPIQFWYLITAHP